MAIRFRADEPQNDPKDNNRGRKNILGNKNVMAAIFMLIFRYPKIGIPLLLVGGMVYFLFSGSGGNNQNFSLGCDINQKKYDKTLVYARLSPQSAKYKLPAKVSLRANAPKRRNQGQQGSCVGWASAYAARTILESVATGKDPNKVAFSPSFLYNQIGLRNCQGAYTGEALKYMTQKGLLSFRKFPYDPTSCNKKPTDSQLQEATNFKIRGYNRLTKTGRNYDVDLEAVKQNIAQGAPVVIAMKVPNSFQDMMGKKVWQPSSNEKRNINNLGGHAMCLIGYDENKKRFELMNSWGEDWGDKGFVWLSYQDFKIFCREAYGLFPHGKAQTAATNNFAISCGFFNSKTKKNIPIQRVGGHLFETTQKIAKNTGFKIEITNSLECYAYIFSKETEQDGGAAITVFPPSPQYSTFLGIVGTRLFPQGGELYPDTKGNKDYMAIVFSKKELNPTELKQKIDAANQGSFYADVMAAVGSRGFQKMNFLNKNNLISFEQEVNNKQDIAVVVLAVAK